jgi:hypothetical protein
MKSSMAAAEDILFAPTPEHAMLRETVRRFAETEVEPQAESGVTGVPREADLRRALLAR